MLFPKARESQQTNLNSDERRVAFLFRTATGTGAAAAELRPPSRGLSVWASPSYRGQVFPSRTLDVAVSIIHSELPKITGSTNDVSKERTRSSDLDGVWTRVTPLQPRSS